MLTRINGVPYPIGVKDEVTFREWLSWIDRSVETSDLASPELREVMSRCYFIPEDDESLSFAKDFVCRQMAMELYNDLVVNPGRALIWRIKPEFDASGVESIRDDMTSVMTRRDLDAKLPLGRPIALKNIIEHLGLKDWVPDFVTDSIYKSTHKLGLYKAYMRFGLRQVNG